MERMLIAYATSEGQTRKVAEYIAQSIRSHGFVVDVIDFAAQAAPLETPYDAYIVGASVHVGRHQPAVAEFVQDNLRRLQSAPSVFFSVSLSIASSRPEQQAAAQQTVDAFLEETGWHPNETWCIAGALRYSAYGFFKRLLMKRIARHDGYSTDTSTDHEYTDWHELDRMVEYFLANVCGPYEYMNES